MVTPRKIVVDEVDFMWTRRHDHETGPCMEKPAVWRADKTGGRLLVRFVDGQLGVTTAGGGWGGYDGGLLYGGRSYNLNRPGVVAALIRPCARAGTRAGKGSESSRASLCSRARTRRTSPPTSESQ